MRRLDILAGDIMHSHADAVALIANTILPGGMNAADSILQAAGVDVPVEKQGESGALLLPGGRLAAGHVIWSAGPEWKTGGRQEAEELAACCRVCLEAAEREAFGTVDLLSISAGVYDSQFFQAASVILRTVRDFLSKRKFPQRVRIICQSRQVDRKSVV